MNSLTTAIFLLSVITFTLGVLPNVNEILKSNRSLAHLGIVEGKMYFYSNNIGNWGAGNTFCTSSGLKLASINTTAQFSFMKNSSIPLTFSYWLSGRDARNINQFVWDEDQSVLNNALASVMDSFNSQVTCLRYIAVNTSSKGTIESTLCSNTSYKFLCES